MKVAVLEADRLTIRQLISSAKGGTLSECETKTLNDCLALSSSLWIGSVDGKFLCAWGLAPPTLLSNEAYLWLFATEEVREHEFLFVRHSQIAIAKMLKEYPRLVGHTMIGSNRSIRWLKWLGARFFDPVNGLLPFMIEGKNG